MFTYILLIIFSFSIMLTALLVPFATKIGQTFNLIDVPNARKQHAKPLVRIGGLAIFLGSILQISFLISFLIKNDIYNYTFDYIVNNNNFVCLIIGSVLFFIIGISDDIYGLSPFIRLIFQFIITIILWNLNFSIDKINIIWELNESSILNLNNITSMILTCVWIVGVTNSINWLDGLDGLASGICFIILIPITISLFLQGNIFIGYYCCSLLGALIAFLYYNFYPAKILMGDGGSYFLGFNISVLSLVANSQLIGDYSLVRNIHLSFFLLLIPLVDMCCVMLSRISRNKSPFYPDRSHIHHRLINLGFSHPNTVSIIYSLQTIIICIFIPLAVI